MTYEEYMAGIGGYGSLKIAVDAGVLNDTNRTRVIQQDLAKMAELSEQAKGIGLKTSFKVSPTHETPHWLILLSNARKAYERLSKVAEACGTYLTFEVEEL